MSRVNRRYRNGEERDKKDTGIAGCLRKIRWYKGISSFVAVIRTTRKYGREFLFPALYGKVDVWVARGAKMVGGL
jgi:hypothetical protein